MQEELQNVFRNVFQDKKLVITPNTTAKDIKMWDSLMHLELIASIEEHFKITFTFTEVMSMNNVGDLLSIIDTKSKQ